VEQAKYLLVGWIVKPHGIRGEVGVKSLTERPDLRFRPGSELYIGPDQGNLQKVAISSARPFKKGYLVAFENIGNRNDAERIREWSIYILRRDAAKPEEDAYYYHELIGLILEDDSGNNANDAYGVPFDRHRAVRPVLVYDRPGEGSTPPYTEFEVESLSGRYGAGWSARITVYGTADKSEFPDNALIILYAEDWYNDVRRSLGGWYGQEGVLFVGHIRADSVTVDSEKSTVSFEAATIDQWMRDVNVWPANFSDPAAAAAAWREFDNMIVEDTLWHLSEMSSNLKDVTDCFFSCGEKALHFVDLTEGSLYDQMSEQVGSCFFGQLSASRQGSIHLFRHKNMMTLPERLMYGPPLLTFTRADWRDELEIGEERQRDSVAQVDFIGFIYDAGGNPQEVYSLAPLRQLNFGGIEKVTGTLLTGQTIVAAQGENDTLSGLYLAWKNIRFPHLRIPAPNNRILEPATQDYFAVDLAEADTTRGFDWDGKEFLCTGMSLDIDNENGFIEVDIEGEASTWGPDGVAGEYPTGVPVPVPDYGGGGGPPGYLPELPPAYEPGTGDLLYMLGQTRMYRTENAWAPPADVVYADLGQIDGGAAVNWFALDSWHPATRAMVVGDDGIYRTSNLDAASPTWERVVDLTVSANIWAHDIVSSICQENLWMATVIDYQPAPANRDLYVYWTVDFGDTWNNVRLTRRASYSQAYIEASSHNAQVAWVTYFHGTDTYGHVVKTTDQWGSYTDNQLTLIDTYNVPNCYHRYFNNPSDDVGLYVNHDSSQICSADYAACTTGVIVTGLPTDIDNWCGGYTWGTGGFWALTRVTGGQTRFHVSDDGSTWAIRQTWPWAGGPPYCVSGWPYDPDWVYAGMHSNNAAPLELSTDRGVTWASQTGNWATLTDETIVCLAPVWVA